MRTGRQRRRTPEKNTINTQTNETSRTKNSSRSPFKHYNYSFHLQTIAALDVSRELAYLSTASDVSRLNFRVRNESGCDPAAMAAIEDFMTGTSNLSKKYSPKYNITDFVWILTDVIPITELSDVSISGLNTSLPSCLHP